VQEVDLSRGMLSRRMAVTDADVRRRFIAELRLVHMAQPHLAAPSRTVVRLLAAGYGWTHVTESLPSPSWTELTTAPEPATACAT
jgi:trehalose/maltose hydrolase-like predicted phosphorylase